MRTLKPLGYPAAKASSVTWVRSSQMNSAEAPGDTLRGQQRLRLVGSCNPEGQGELRHTLLEGQPFTDCSSGVPTSLAPSALAFQLVPEVCFSNVHTQCGWSYGSASGSLKIPPPVRRKKRDFF